MPYKVIPLSPIRIEELRDPILVEGLPGIGLVGHMAVDNLIRAHGARPIFQILSTEFQPISMAEDGDLRPQRNELYLLSDPSVPRDLILLFGNAQASNPSGQYELAECALRLAKGMGCRLVITLGGLKRDSATPAPRIFCTATDPKLLSMALSKGAGILQGRVFGAAGILVGLAELMGMPGLCLLAETPGFFGDAIAAKAILLFLSRFLGAELSTRELDAKAEGLADALEKMAKGIGGEGREVV
ncbi:MAG: PAC2 family protein [Candidatus Bathyarchaeia archaeon]